MINILESAQKVAQTGISTIVNGPFIVKVVVLLLASIAAGSLVGGVNPLVGAFAAFGLGALIFITGLFDYGKPKSTAPSNDTTRETEMVPYEDWPESCYTCNGDIKTENSDGDDIRGQLVIHRAEGESNYKSVGLCEECTWLYSTLADNHDTLVSIYDKDPDVDEL